MRPRPQEIERMLRLLSKHAGAAAWLVAGDGSITLVTEPGDGDEGAYRAIAETSHGVGHDERLVVVGRRVHRLRLRRVVGLRTLGVLSREDGFAPIVERLFAYLVAVLDGREPDEHPFFDPATDGSSGAPMELALGRRKPN